MEEARPGAGKGPEREETPILFVAAEAREYSGLLRRCKEIEGMDWPIEFARKAVLNGRRVVLAANGAGRRRAGQVVEVAQAKMVECVVVSTGYCGALDPAYDVGDVVVADRILADGEAFPVATPATRRPHRTGSVISIDRVASGEEKERLRGAGATAVEMESAGVAQRVRQWEVQIFCIRVVTDTSREEFSLDLNACRLPDGRFSTARIVGQALKQPWSGIPELLRLRRNSEAASRALGDFLADCSF